jgi:aminopeptidase YwaD
LGAGKLKLALAALLAVAILAVAGVVVLAGSSWDGDNDSAVASTATKPAATEPADTVGPAGTATAGATVESTAPPTTASPGPSKSDDAQPDGERILDDVKTLSDGTGPRAAGTEAEMQAATIIAERLRGDGYEVSVQEFSIGTQIGRSSSLSVTAPSAKTVPTLPVENTGSATVSGRVVSAGIGRPEDFPATTKGSIALVERGGLFFNDKVVNAVAAGAIGVIIYNNEAGLFYGSSSQPAKVPVVAISDTEGKSLRDAATAGNASAEVSIGDVSSANSHNVIAKPPGKACETVTGGHYDSVIQAPGASDNATGTSTVLEIASVMAQNDDMHSNCFVLFGAEEVGLLGSAHYVKTLTPDEKQGIKAMLNFDMVGVGDQAWWLIGDPDLQKQASDLAKALNIEDAQPSTLSRGLSSDHASFLNAGIPAIMFHRWEDNLLHTPQDVSGRVQADYLGQAARMGVALLTSLDDKS